MREGSETILYEIGKEWNEASKSHRDSQLSVGRMIHSFIITRLKEGDCLSQLDRRMSGYTRESCLKMVTKKLGVQEFTTRMLLGTAMAVDLLSDRGNVGNLAYTSLRMFQVLVRRASRENIQRQTYRGNEGEMPPSSIELWEIVPECREWAVQNFREIVTENWKMKEIERFLKSKKCKYVEIPNKKSLALTQFMRTVQRVATSRAADMILEVISVSKNPDLLRKTLESKLREV